MIKKRMEKENTECPDLGTRNFMLPSYHQKTFYKAATSLHMQTENSLKAPEHVLRNDFRLNHRAGGGNDSVSQPGSNQEVVANGGAGARGALPGLDPTGFARAVLENCGEYRKRDPRVVTTGRGTDFMRKLGALRSPDPARTFFGAAGKDAFKTYGLPGAGSLAATHRDSSKPFGAPGLGRNGGLFATQSGHSSIMLIVDPQIGAGDYAGTGTL